MNPWDRKKLIYRKTKNWRWKRHSSRNRENFVKSERPSVGRAVHCIDQLNDILSNVKPFNQTIIQK